MFVIEDLQREEGRISVWQVSNFFYCNFRYLLFRFALNVFYKFNNLGLSVDSGLDKIPTAKGVALVCS